MADYKAFFKDTFGFEQPYDHQLRTLEALAEGKSVILRAPTGSGKTEAALAPFLYALDNMLDFPRRALYAVPMRVLAKQLKDRVCKKTKRRQDFKVTIQTGENPDDPYFTGDFVLTTIDQLLSAYLHIPLSLPERLSNVNAGAVISSYLVFDEFHLYDHERALLTMLYLLDDLRWIPFALMTATLSEGFLNRLKDHYGRSIEVVNVCEDPVKVERAIAISDSPINGHDVIKRHKGKTLVICNTVRRAIEVYRKIIEGKPECETLLLHSRFYPSDRKEKDEKAVEMLGKKGKGGILVTTQVVEVGMDISADVLWTEAAPADSLVQRAGRCARWGGGKGEVIICPVLDAEKENAWLPYKADYCLDAFNYLKSHKPERLGWLFAQKMIDKLMGKRDSETFDAYKNKRGSIRKYIGQAIAGAGRGISQDLIRNVDSVQVLIYEDPRTNAPPNPFEYEWIPTSTGSLYAAKEFAEKNEISVYLWVPVLKEDGYDEEQRTYEYEYRQPDNVKSFFYPWYILSPKVATYSKEYGLELGTPGIKPPELKLSPKKRYDPITYRLESYEEHIKKLLGIYRNRFEPFSKFPFKRIAEAMQIEPGHVETLQKLVFVFHDAGKLSKAWQEAAHGHQKRKGYTKPSGPDTLLAHTDFDPKEDRRTGLPPHAVAGAFATRDLVISLAEHYRFGDRESFYGAYLLAVSRHHSPYALSHPAFDVGNEVVEFMKKLARENVSFSFTDKDFLTQLDAHPNVSNYFPDPGSVAFKIYQLLVRNLRLCELHYSEEGYG